MEQTEREELEALLDSPGWAVFHRYVQSEWGPGGRAFESAAIAAADQTTNPNAIAHLQQIIASRREILRIVQWPGERLKALKEAQPSLVTASVPLSRRGHL